MNLVDIIIITFYYHFFQRQQKDRQVIPWFNTCVTISLGITMTISLAINLIIPDLFRSYVISEWFFILMFLFLGGVIIFILKKFFF